jgi:ABC-type dipeptide/oligopeptide/nickel transport system permease subunit
MAFLLGPLLSRHSPYGVDVVRAYDPHLLWLPSAVFFLLMVCFNPLGDGLDPRMRS